MGCRSSREHDRWRNAPDEDPLAAEGNQGQRDPLYYAHPYVNNHRHLRYAVMDQRQLEARFSNRGERDIRGRRLNHYLLRERRRGSRRRRRNSHRAGAMESAALYDLGEGGGNHNRESRGGHIIHDGDLDQLRSGLDAFEDLFRRLLLDVTMDGTDLISVSGGCPPASRSAIERLPTMKVSVNDFDDEPTRECCICFLNFEVGNEVCRLPCGHIFHEECVSQWLRKKCTCPECRWEVETEDELFEAERLERMKTKKIRVKDHELDRLCIAALQDMAGNRDLNNRDKLIETIKGSDSIDVVH